MRTYYHTTRKILFGIEKDHQDILYDLLAHYETKLGLVEMDDNEEPIRGTEDILDFLFK